MSPFLADETAVPYIPGLIGGADVFGLTDLELTDFNNVVLNAPLGAVGAVVRMHLGRDPMPAISRAMTWSSSSISGAGLCGRLSWVWARPIIWSPCWRADIGTIRSSVGTNLKTSPS